MAHLLHIVPDFAMKEARASRLVVSWRLFYVVDQGNCRGLVMPPTRVDL
jgi:hypothetical protein